MPKIASAQPIISKTKLYSIDKLRRILYIVFFFLGYCIRALRYTTNDPQIFHNKKNHVVDDGASHD